MTGMGPAGSDSVIRTAKYVLGVAAVIAFVIVVLAALSLLSFKAHAEQPRIGWQLGICVDDPEVGRRCRLIGAPLPDEQLCRALRDSMRSKINAGRVHCARVLIDAEYET